MENLEIKNLEDKIQQSLMANGLLTAFPQLIDLYPKIISLIEIFDTEIDKYLDEQNKIIVIAKKNGKTRAIILDGTKEFTLTNEMKINATHSPVISNYNKNDIKEKILNSTVLNILKTKYENQNTQE
ncbi:MAG: hypothetical protein IT243_06090 [Bacteroidia bacterium]|nr:hypothetical protein [Bacteroidia bacterium]